MRTAKGPTVGEGDGFHVEEHPERQERNQERLEAIVNTVVAEGLGEHPAPIRARLEELIAEAGIPEQPTKWVGDTATEIAAGRTVNVDRDHEIWADLTREQGGDDRDDRGGGPGAD